MKQSTVFDLIEYMPDLIRSEERKRCSELKIQLVHFQILKYLSCCNKYSDTPAAIENYLGITRGTVSQSLLVLEKKEFIKKIQDNIDKRGYHILLLNKGHSTLKKSTQLFNKASELLELSVVEVLLKLLPRYKELITPILSEYAKPVKTSPKHHRDSFAS